MRRIATIASILQRRPAPVLLAAPLLGMGPANIALGLTVLWMLCTIVSTRYVVPAGAKPWLAGIAIYVATHVLVACLSPEPAVSLRYVAKDWRTLGLLAAAAGYFAHLSSRGFLIVLCVAGISLLYSMAALHGFHLAEFGLPKRYNAIRTSGLLPNPNILAGVVMSLLFAPLLFPLKRSVKIACWIICGALLLMTGTRAAWLGTISGMLVLLFFSRGMRRTAITLSLLGTALLMLAIPGTQTRIKQIPAEMNKARIELWHTAWDMGRANLLGVGPGRFEAAHPNVTNFENRRFLHAHNVPLHLFAEGGFLLVSAWLLLIGTWVSVLWKRRSTAHACVGLALLAALLTADMFSHMFYRGTTAVPFFFLLGHALWLSGAGITQPQNHPRTNQPHQSGETERKT